jgi:hypothetical protein
MRSLKRPSLLLVLFFISALHPHTSSAQTSEARRVTAAADSFYRMHAAHFGFPLEPDLKRLRPYVSPTLNALLAGEVRRMREWSKRNPDQKPPVIEDLFVCNRYDKPQKFSVEGVKVEGSRADATVKFVYEEGGRVVQTCDVDATFVRLRGRWLLDNVAWPGSADLRTLLSRRDYEKVPR